MVVFLFDLIPLNTAAAVLNFCLISLFLNVSMAPGTQGIFTTVGASCGVITVSSLAGVVYSPYSCVVLFSDPRPEEVMLPTADPELPLSYYQFVNT